jgi:hypothetical protein
MRVWCLKLTGSPELSAEALVVAPDAPAASAAVLASLADWSDSPQEVIAVDEVVEPPQVLDLHMPDPAVECAATAVAAGPALWRVNWNDGLFHRTAGASLVAADSAIDALRIVLAADPYEGQPPYGVPSAFGPVERFHPTRPYVVWVNFDDRDT